ncbi:lipocalin family protein [Hymenobacter sp. M29]|uniref:Lipocalin family protein n=1 Tax=Hymenobacter mellowenesis TaxID=3063995 RepID=A0ABT9AAM9_9BACT|nr:lipocalin family protein [Hymenobacter sp. M29]MDO7846884.1 lipocalin family protein [Hymenobacter sp. M29]
MKQLEGTWLNSHEENAGDTLVYRPNTYRFPPARGRTGFAFKEYGRFEQFDIAPTDGLAGRPGTWVIEGNSLNKVRIHLNEGPEPDYDLEVISLKNKILKLRKLPVEKSR